MKKIILAAVFYAIACNAFTQRADSLTVKDYKHAENFLSFTTEQFVDTGKLFLIGWPAINSGIEISPHMEANSS